MVKHLRHTSLAFPFILHASYTQNMARLPVKTNKFSYFSSFFLINNPFDLTFYFENLRFIIFANYKYANKLIVAIVTTYQTNVSSIRMYLRTYIHNIR